jgi:hypothetical protein
MKKARKEYATWKRSCERNRAIFKTILNEHYIVVIEKHIRVFLLGLQLEKKCSRRRCISMFGAFSYSAK